MRKIYEVKIQWLDDEKEIVSGLLFEEGDFEDNDNIFFYISSENDLKELMKEGSANDFIVLDYHKLNS
jgi:hypothetical protein